MKIFQEDIKSSNGYQLVEPINISTGSDWANYSFITGNGSASNPYIIENVEIIGEGVQTIEYGNDTRLDISSVGIYINAGGSFIIRNCKISHLSIGIYLYIGVSPGFYPISNIEIADCSIGIYSKWHHVGTNISNCYIHDCNWVSITAKFDLDDFLDYGGIGIRVRNEGEIINCRIEDCSVGMMAGQIKKIQNNKLINCGIIPDLIYLYVTDDYDESNMVNGKPIGIFGSYWGDDNLVFTQNDALQYGQLIFALCDNLTLSNIYISEPCSIAIQLFSLGDNQTTYLNNIVCENQKLGMYIYGKNVIGNNLYVKNSDAGFYFVGIRNSTITKVMTDNIDVPIYALSPIENFAIEIEHSTDFYLIDSEASYRDILDIKPGDDVSMSNITELGIQGYQVQFDYLGTYHLNLTLYLDLPFPATPKNKANFTIVSVPRYVRPDIYADLRTYPLFLYWSLIITGIVVLIEFSRRFYQK